MSPTAHPRPTCAEDLTDRGQLVEIGAQDRAGLAERSRTGVRVARPRDDEAPGTDRHSLPDCLEDPVGPQLDEDDVGRLRQVRERRRDGQPADLGVLRVDRVEVALEAKGAAVLERDPPHERARACPDDGDRARPEDRGQVHGMPKCTGRGRWMEARSGRRMAVLEQRIRRSVHAPSEQPPPA